MKKAIFLTVFCMALTVSVKPEAGEGMETDIA
jgi:hypothetical protein